MNRMTLGSCSSASSKDKIPSTVRRNAAPGSGVTKLPAMFNEYTSLVCGEWWGIGLFWNVWERVDGLGGWGGGGAGNARRTYETHLRDGHKVQVVFSALADNFVLVRVRQHLQRAFRDRVQEQQMVPGGWP